MRKQLEYLANDVNRIDGDNLYQAINDFKQVLNTLIELMDRALPKDVEPD